MSPEDAGLPTAALEDLAGGDAAQNAEALKAVLQGEAGPYRDIVLYGSAAALLVAGKIEDLKLGVAMAKDAIDSGRAAKVLEELVAVTNEGTGA